MALTKTERKKRQDLLKKGFKKCGNILCENPNKTVAGVLRLDEFYQDRHSASGYVSHCKICYKQYKQTQQSQASNKKYRQSEKGKASNKKYKQSGKGKKTEQKYKQSEKGQKATREYRQTETYKQYTKSDKRKAIYSKFSKTEKGRALQAKHRKTEKYKVSQKKYSLTEKGRAKRKRHETSFKGRQSARKRTAIRRTRITQIGGSYTPEQWHTLCKFYGFRCLMCDKQFSFVDLTVDHIIPVSKGGTSNIDNLQPLCKLCNCSKHDKTLDLRHTVPDWIKRDSPIYQQLKLL